MKPLNAALCALAFLGTARAETPEAGLPHAFDAGWHGQKTCELLYETAEVRVGQCTFPPGVGHERHYHNAHFGYVLAGGRMQIADASCSQEAEFTAGTKWQRDARTVHEAINVGDTTASYLIVEPRPDIATRSGTPSVTPAVSD